MRGTTTTAEPFVPDGASLAELRTTAADCRGCDLYRTATQVVFSAGSPDAPLVLVGEQPGDIEDRRGEPFVGPAGALLDRALTEAGLDRSEAYLTNAVKHFKFHFDRNGKRRIHDKPGRVEIVACRPWLVAEFRLLSPRVVVALGATAAQALAGPAFRVTKSRGQVFDWPQAAQHPEDFPMSDPAARFVATLHPSSVLRADDRETAFAELVADLRVVRGIVVGHPDVRRPVGRGD
jgi:uracil-DNA glycosylase family protein